jgi:hypothetical protein
VRAAPHSAAFLRVEPRQACPLRAPNHHLPRVNTHNAPSRQPAQVTPRRLTSVSGSTRHPRPCYGTHTAHPTIHPSQATAPPEPTENTWHAFTRPVDGTHTHVEGVAPTSPCHLHGFLSPGRYQRSSNRRESNARRRLGTHDRTWSCSASVRTSAGAKISRKPPFYNTLTNTTTATSTTRPPDATESR